MESLDRAAFDRIVAVHGAAPPEWGVAIPVPGDPAFPALLLPAKLLVESAPAIRLVVRNVQPDAHPVLFLALGSGSQSVPDLKDLGSFYLLLVCDARWRPLWRAALEKGRIGIAARGAKGLKSREIDEAAATVLAAFVADADHVKQDLMLRFAIDHKRLTKELAKDRSDAVLGLRALEESWAREILGLPVKGELHDQIQARLPVLAPDAARAALKHLSAAEEWQWEIGTWSTSGGEGLASMSEVYTLKLAQAWLALATGDAAVARSLAEAVAADPNDLGAFFRASIADLRRRTQT